MNMSPRTLWVFLAALSVMTSATSQLWDLALALRNRDAAGTSLGVALVSIPVFVLSAVVVLRILYLTARPRREP